MSVTLRDKTYNVNIKTLYSTASNYSLVTRALLSHNPITTLSIHITWFTEENEATIKVKRTVQEIVVGL